MSFLCARAERLARPRRRRRRNTDKTKWLRWLATNAATPTPSKPLLVMITTFKAQQIPHKQCTRDIGAAALRHRCLTPSASSPLLTATTTRAPCMPISSHHLNRQQQGQPQQQQRRQRSRRRPLAALSLLLPVLLLPLLLVLLPAAAVAVREAQDVGFIREPPPASAEAGEFEAAAAAMAESCPPEPIVDGQPKAEWPELVGKPEGEARALLGQQAPGFALQVIPFGGMATMEWRCDRIRLWLDAQGNLAQPPRIG